jgi:hypothetical protein
MNEVNNAISHFKKMRAIRRQEMLKVLETISKDRPRTNILKKHEQNTLVYLVQRIPPWMHSDWLTLIGFFGSLITFSGFILATYVHKNYLLLGILGLAINWFGDSLDGRFAYFRKKPRKWYGFSLDFSVDWITTILIGCGYMIYTNDNWKLLGFGFVVMYGWAMITALLRYKVTDKYTIDSGLFGPTEVRIIIALILLAEVLFHNVILYAAIGICIILFLVNILESVKLLYQADKRDKLEKQAKMKAEND